MKSEILSQEGNVVVVKAEYEAGEVDGAVGKTVRELSKSANIKGFRKGHIPRGTLELFFGKNAIYRETLERLANGALENVITEYDLSLVVDPKLKVGDLNEGSPVEIEFVFEVRPEVELPDISSLSAEKTVYVVRDEDVDQGLRQLFESNAKIEPSDEDRPAEKDDIVEVRYSSFEVHGNGSLKELERNKNSVLHLSGIREDLSGPVIGHKPADELSFDVTLESDYPDPRMAGKTVRYEMEILHFMKRVVLDMTDENIAEISRGRYGTLDEIKAEIRSQLEMSAEARGEGTLNESAINALSEAASVDVPASMVDRQYQTMRRDHDGILKDDVNQSLDDYLKNNNLSVEEYDGKLRQRAERMVRNTLVLEALAERDEITFTGDDLNDEIFRTANAMRVNPQEFADALSRDKREFSAFAAKVRTKNAVKHLSKLVQVTEKRENFSSPEDGDGPSQGDSACENAEYAQDAGL